MKILVVDDDRTFLEQVKMFLKKESKDLQVDTAEGVEDALDMLEEGDYQAVVSDYQMSELNGLDLLEGLRERDDDTPFIMFTGKSREEVAIKALNLGADRYIQKGGDPKAQFGVLANAVEQEVKHKRISDEFTEKKEEYKLITESFYDMISLVDIQENEMILVSDAVEDLLGYSPEELTGKRFFDMLHPEDKDTTVELLSQKIDEGDLEGKFEDRVLCKNGEYKWVENRFKIIPDEDDEPEKLLIVSRDSSDEKREEFELNKLMDKYRLLYENDWMGLIVIEEDSSISLVNKKFLDLTGYSKEEVYGRHWQEFIYEEDLEMMKEYRRKRLEDPESVPYEYETRIMDKKGDIKRVVLNIEMIEGSNKVIAMIIDTSEERLKVELSKGIRESQHVGALVVQDGEIKWGNPAIERLYGAPTDELVGTDPLMSIPEDERERVHELSVNMLKGERNDPYEHMFITSGGDEGWLLEQATPIEFEGRGAALVTFIDISFQKDVRDALESSEEQYRMLVENTTDVIYFADVDGTMEYVSPQVEEYGYTRDELMGNNMLEYVHREDRKKVLEAYSRTIETGEIFPTEVRLIDGDGNVVHMEERGKPVYEEGEIIGVTGVIRDVTERKKMEERLKEAEERYEALFDRSMDAVYIHDLEGNFLDANDAALELLGYDKEEVMDLNFQEILVEGQMDEAFKTLEEVLETGTQEELTKFKLKTKDGEHIWVETKSSLIYEEGEPRAVLGLARDITERRETERALRESEEKYRNLFEVGPHATFMLNAEGKFTKVNEVACELTGYSREEMIGTTVWDAEFFPPESKEKIMERFMSKLESGEEGGFSPYTVKVVRKDGEIAYGEIDTRVVREDDEIKEVIGTAWDVTERKKMEEELRESEERLSSVINNSKDGIVIHKEGEIRFINPVVSERLGYTEEELLDMNIIEMIVPEDREKVFDRYRDRVLGKDVKDLYEITITKKDGSTLPIEISSTIINYEDEECALVFIRDITERKEAEEKLKASEEKFRTLFENTLDGIILIDAEDLEVLEANKAALDILGYDSWEDVDSLHPFDHVYEDDREKVTEIFMKDMLREDLQQREEFRVLTNSGEVAWVSVLGTRTEYRGRLAGLISLRDITERKEKERELKENRDRVEKLHRIATDLETLGSEEEILVETLNGADEILDFDESLIAWVEDGGFTIKASKGMEYENDRIESLERGIIGKTYQTGESYLIGDIERSKDADPYDDRYRSAISIPIGRYGVFQAISYEKDNFDGSDLKMAQILLSHSKEVLNRVQTENELRRSKKIYEKVYHTTISLAEHENFEKVIQIIADEATELLNTTDCKVYLADREEGILKPIYSNDPEYKEEIMSYDIPFGEGITGAIADIGEIDYINYDQEDPYSIHLPGTDEEEEEEESVISAPLYHQGELIGALTLGKIGGKFSDPDIDKLDIFARQAEVAINRADNLKKLKKSRRRLEENKRKIERLHEVSSKLEQCETEQEIYELTVDAAENVLEFDMGEILIAEGDRLKVRATSEHLPPSGTEDMSIHEGIAGKTYRNKRSYLLEDIGEDEEAKPTLDKYRSGMSIPIGKYGVFQAESTEERKYDEEDLKMAELLVSHVVETINDLRYRKSIKESEERYRALVETALAGIAITDFDNKIQFLNDHLAEMLGYKKEELEGMNLSELTVEEELDSYIKEIESGEEGGTSVYETKLVKKDGMEIDVRVNASPFKDAEGNYVGTMGVITDITESKKLREREHFLLTLLRHDMKNKVQIVQGYLQLLQEDTDISDEQYEMIEKTLGATKEEIDLLNKVGILKEINHEEETKTVGIDHLIKEAIEKNETIAEESGMDIEYSNMEAEAKGGPLLDEAFSNLIENSIRHSGGDLIKIYGEEKPDELIVTVEDDGKGIADDKKVRLFEKGYKGKGSSGSGIGMYLVKTIIGNYGGEIDVKDSELGGARFDLRLRRG